MKKVIISITMSIVFLFQGNLFGVLANDPNFIRTISEQVVKYKEGGIFNFSFKSSLDGQIQPLCMKIPKGYDPSKEWPLLVVLHGLGDGPIIVSSIDSMVQIGPFGRGDLYYRGLGEKDVFETLEMARKIFNIDEDRIYLTGFSMGGSGTFALGLKYPSVWAACVPVCGTLRNSRLLENGENLPFWIHAGGKDAVVPASYSKEIYEQGKNKGFTHWRYTEHDDMGHSFQVNWSEIEKWLLDQKRKKEVHTITYRGQIPVKIYWIEVQKLVDSERPYRIEANVKDQVIHLKTQNIEKYQIHAEECPVSGTRELIVYENGIQINLEDTDCIFK